MHLILCFFFLLDYFLMFLISFITSLYDMMLDNVRIHSIHRTHVPLCYQSKRTIEAILLKHSHIPY